MKYNDAVIDELYNMVCESNEEAQNKLYDYCEPQINYMINKYKNIAFKCGIDPKDFKQEALLAFSNALKDYNGQKDASLKTFVSLCVERRLIKIIRDAKKRKGNLSLEYEYNTGLNLKDTLIDNEADPLIKFSEADYLKHINNKIKLVLSDFEYQVYEYVVKGLNYIEISKILDKSPKQIDNTIQRIKKKIKIIVKEDENEKEV